MLSAIGCEKFQITPGIFVQFAIHGGDQFFFVFVEDRPPLFFGLKIDEVFGIEEAGRIRAVIGASHLADRQQ